MPYRVKDENGHHVTVAVVSDGQTVLEDEPALDRNGRWAAPKYQIPRSRPATGKATPATTKAKEATA